MAPQKRKISLICMKQKTNCRFSLPAGKLRLFVTNLLMAEKEQSSDVGASAAAVAVPRMPKIVMRSFDELNPVVWFSDLELQMEAHGSNTQKQKFVCCQDQKVFNFCF